jgi:hypothetical protein
MSRLRFNKVATPSTPASNKAELYYSSTSGKLESIDQVGVVHKHSYDGWRDRPVIYNGSFEFWQRQVPVTATTYSSVGGRVYCADRWWTSNETASITAARVDTVGAVETGISSRHYGTIAKLTNTGKFAMGQTLGAGTMAHIRGTRVRMQFKLKTTASLEMRMSLVQLTAAGTTDAVPINAAAFITAWGANGVDPTLGAALSYLVPVANTADGGTISGNAMTCACTTSWTRVSCCFDVPIDAKNLVLMVWTNNQFTAAQACSFAEAALYDGPEIRTDFVPYASALEILRIQRYYQKSFNLDIAPAASQTVANAGPGATGNIFVAGAVAKACNINIRFPVRMRTVNPTITLYTPVGAGAVPYRITGTTPAVQTTVVQTGIHDFGLQVQATGDAAGTVGDVCGVHWTAEAEL